MATIAEHLARGERIREIDGRLVAVPRGCPSSRHDVEDDNWDFNPFAVDRDATLAATRRLLELDGNAAVLVAATVSTVQSTNESRPAFVKRMVRAWLDEMGRGV